jgi:hypothetical protein
MSNFSVVYEDPTYESPKDPYEQALAEFLANGGVVQQVEPFASGIKAGETGYSSWGKPKKKKKDAGPELEAHDLSEVKEDLALDPWAVMEDPHAVN